MATGRKVMLLGAVGVGKTSLAQRLAFDRFDGNYKATIGVDISSVTVTIPDGPALPLVLWDSDGDFGTSVFANTYLKGASAAVVVADATRPATIPHLRKLVLGFRDMLPGRPCAAILNKVDLLPREPVLPPEDYGSPDLTVATSALSGHGVRPAFAKLAAIILRRSL